jgi:hypothetical protein
VVHCPVCEGLPSGRDRTYVACPCGRLEIMRAHPDAGPVWTWTWSAGPGGPVSFRLLHSDLVVPWGPVLQELHMSFRYGGRPGWRTPRARTLSRAVLDAVHARIASLVIES